MGKNLLASKVRCITKSRIQERIPTDRLTSHSLSLLRLIQRQAVYVVCAIDEYVTRGRMFTPRMDARLARYLYYEEPLRLLFSRCVVSDFWSTGRCNYLSYRCYTAYFEDTTFTLRMLRSSLCILATRPNWQRVWFS